MRLWAVVYAAVSSPGRLDAGARELDARALALVDLARRNGLGLYTTEQAADDFAVEILSAMGFGPDEVLGAWLDFMRAIERSFAENFDRYQAYLESTGDKTAAQCKALLDQGFPAHVSLGALEHPHHASCYRLFNIWREQRAHRFATGPRPTPLEPAWSVLRARAAEVSAAAVEPLPQDSSPAPTGVRGRITP